MSDQIIRGYWDCPYCDRKDIDGLVDECPSCGRHKPDRTKYHLKGGVVLDEMKYYTQPLTSETVSSEELREAGISEEECDGNHKEWVCDYCNSLNNYSDEFCTSCGSPKKEASKEYGMSFRKNMQENEGIFGAKSETSQNGFYTTWDNIRRWMKAHNFPVLLATVFFCILGGILFWPHKEIVTVSGFSWERNISIEDYRTVKESGWSIPDDGRVYDERMEIKTYVSVVDHYRTVSEVKTRKVLDHYNTNYTYSDNGNGTFTQHSHQTPVYRTETYTDVHQEPVYRQDPVYATKYYYEIERWMDSGKDFPSSGNDKRPYWNKDYTLSSNERDTDRTESYWIHYDNGRIEKDAYDNWLTYEVGDKMSRVYSIIGITYKTEWVSVSK